MKDSKVQNQSYLRNINQKTILNLLMKEKMSCSEIAKIMKLSNTAIANITEELAEKKLLIKQESQNFDVGRRPIMLQINPDCGALYIISLAGRQAVSCIVNMAGDTVCRQYYNIDSKITKDLLFKIIKDLKEMHIKNCQNLKLLTVCIATPGKTDLQTGNFLLAHHFADYKNINLKQIFSESFNCQILIYNDIKLALEGERTYGSNLNCIKNAMMLHIGYSVGSALMLGEKIYNGSHGFAGELTAFSLNTLADSGDMFFPQNLNSLDSLSVEGIIKFIKHTASLNNKEKSNTTITGENATLNNIITAYQSGDNLVKNIIEQAAMVWARNIRNMTEFLDIEVIIINGDIVKFGDGFKNLIEEYVNNYLKFQDIKVFYTELENDGVLLGCVNTAIKSALNVLLNDV